MNNPNFLWLEQVGIEDVHKVGGKNASLGEMIQHLQKRGIQIPNGFVVTTYGYDEFMEYNKLNSEISELLEQIDYEDCIQLKRIGIKIRNLILNGEFPENMKRNIYDYYAKLSSQYTDYDGLPQDFTDVAVRSSGTAEDMPEASFAGQQETYLNIRGKDQLCNSIRKCFASLYTDRAISYRHTFQHHCEISEEENFGAVKISVCVQKMVRSDLASSGVAFSLDTETGSPNIILMNGSWGLGELIVGGGVNPDEFLLFKPKLKEGYNAIIDKKMGNKLTKMVYGSNLSEVTKESIVEEKDRKRFCLSDKQILQLGKWILDIESYYSDYYDKWCPVDVEWAIDGLSGEIFIVQARPETIHSNKNENSNDDFVEYKFLEKNIENNYLLKGISVGEKIGHGKVKIMHTMEDRDGTTGIRHFEEGDILVTDMTDPDWEPLMKKASAIITNKGGRTCHSSIVARELGIPAVVGTINAHEILQNDMEVTVSCCEGEIGYVYDGILQYTQNTVHLSDIPKTKTKIMMNVATPEKALTFSKFPNSGVGLAREEFIINNFIKAHPLALLNYDKINDVIVKQKLEELISGYASPKNYYVDKLAYGIARIASAFYPKDVIVRFSDFKTNEYSNLLGGKEYEPDEENPMIGWRGASRYYSKEFEEAFGLECTAIQKVRNEMGLKNVIVMIPFCRTTNECEKVLETMKKYGLSRKSNDNLKVYLMCELPSNVILASEFAKYVDGFSIGSNDLTQLTLGVDRDSSLVAHVYDERNEAIKMMIRKVIKKCKKANIKVGICGQAPSDFPDFTQFLVEEGIDSISVTPDTICKTYARVALIEEEKKIIKK